MTNTAPGVGGRGDHQCSLLGKIRCPTDSLTTHCSVCEQPSHRLNNTQVELTSAQQNCIYHKTNFCWSNFALRVCQAIALAMFEFIYRYSINPRKNLDCKKKLDHLKMLDKNCPLRPPLRENLFQPTILKQVLIVKRNSQRNNTVPCFNVAFCSVYLR